ncbi:uncharacterized protein [Linepithema humile]|uniref:uncharacterized protein n=1 Tax=Linepithema humile TaxID=83485 RepID=UPI00351E98F9
MNGMENKNEYLPSQGNSETPVVGAYEGIVPALDASSSCVGLAGLSEMSDSVKPTIISNTGIELLVKQMRKRVKDIGACLNPDPVQDEMQRSDTEEGFLPSSLVEVTMTPDPEAGTAAGKKKTVSVDANIMEYMDLTGFSEDESLASSTKTVSSRGTKRPKKTNAKKRKFRNEVEKSSSEEEEGNKDMGLTYKQRLEADTILKDIGERPAAEIGAYAKEWLRQVEDARAKSKNIKGTLNKNIKVHTHAALEAVDILSKRASMVGDTDFLQGKIEKLEREMTKIKNENEMLKIRLEKMTTSVQREDTPSPTPTENPTPSCADEVDFPALEGIIIPPAIRPPILGVSKVIDEGRILRNRTTKSRPREKHIDEVRYQPEIDMETEMDMDMNVIGESARTVTVTENKRQDHTSEILLAINGLTEVVKNLVHLHTREPAAINLEQRRKEEIISKNRLTSKKTPKAATSTAPTAAPGPSRLTAAPAASSMGTATTATPGKKKKIKISEIEDKANQQTEPLWTEVLGKKAKKKAKGKENLKMPNITGNSIKMKKKEEVRNNLLKNKKKRLSRSAAVSITCLGEDKYTETLQKAQAAINLDDVGIENPKIRPSVTGGIIIQIPGEKASEKADILATRLRKTFEGEEVRIGRPTQKMDLRISELDDATTPEMVVNAIATKGECHPDDIYHGPIRRYKGGMGAIWVQAPALAALKVAEGARLRIGWTMARIAVLPKRPVQCYRCLARGHTSNRCPPANVDRSTHCYNCGDPDHKIGTCTKKACCPICKAKGMKDNHRAGSPECPPCSPIKGRSRGTPTLALTTRTETNMEIEDICTQ